MGQSTRREYNGEYKRLWRGCKTRFKLRFEIAIFCEAGIQISLSLKERDVRLEVLFGNEEIIGIRLLLGSDERWLHGERDPLFACAIFWLLCSWRKWFLHRYSEGGPSTLLPSMILLFSSDSVDDPSV